MELRLFNSLTRRLEPIQPLAPPVVTMYTCGPTVYNQAHIGNFRSFLYEDLLRRTLKFFGFTVRHVLNFTDVDDKTIRGAQAAGWPLRKFTDQYIAEFRRDLERLQIEPQEVQARATDFIPQMMAMIVRLMDRGHAYASGDGSVYFRVNSFARYGELARLDKEGLQVGARVAQDEYVKESYGDFALWKAWSADDGEVGWDSPWGRGRPGWHIECSAMSQHFLGEEIDIHCGGIDLLFPHHENEIAQCECSTGKPFARLWGHCAHLLVDGQKMSKSLGNLYTVQDVLDRGYTGRELRYALLTTNYRQEMNFNWDRMLAAKESVARIDDWRRRWGGLPVRNDGILSELSGQFLGKFRAELAQDLNIMGALGHLFDYLRETNRLLDGGAAPTDLEAVWLQVDSILGLGDPAVEVPPEVSELAAQRTQARKGKNWGESDRLRAAIEKLGWTVRDKSGLQELVRK